MRINVDMEAQVAISCSHTRMPEEGLGCIQLSCWPCGEELWEDSQNSPTTQADAKTKRVVLCKLTVGSYKQG